MKGLNLHLAGPVDADDQQRCTQCGTVLKDFRSTPSWKWTDRGVTAGPQYPEGAIVARGRGWQAMSLTATEPTCTGERR